jgi:hypothetical protein
MTKSAKEMTIPDKPGVVLRLYAGSNNKLWKDSRLTK